MKAFDYSKSIAVTVFTLDGTLISAWERTFINRSHLKIFLKDNLYMHGNIHVFIDQDGISENFITNRNSKIFENESD